MPRMGHANPRTYGKILKDSKREIAYAYSETTHKFDVAHYEATGEIKYLDEEVQKVPNMEKREASQRFREEVTTIEQFEVIGSYSQVAKKYGISKSTAHNHMKSLRVKKVREEKEMLERQVRPTMEEIETFHTDVAPQELPKVEFGVTAILPSDKQNVSPVESKDAHECDCRKEDKETPYTSYQEKEITSVTYCRECGDLIIPPGNDGFCDACHSEINKQVDELEKVQWHANEGVSQVRSIEEMRKSIESDVATLHKMEIAQAERNFQSWLAGVLEGC